MSASIMSAKWNAALVVKSLWLLLVVTQQVVTSLLEQKT